MNPEHVKTSLRMVNKTYRDILEQFNMTPIIEGVDVSKEAYDRAKRNQARTGQAPEPWGYTIHHDQPLQFRRIAVPNSIELQVDVYCDIRWEDDILPVKQDIKVRLWSKHEPTIFREDLDAEKILERLTDNTKPYATQRVVSRFHLDKANLDQRNGPTYHMQVGGKSEEYEVCWHPEKVNVPRFTHQPMDLFLACQMIAANFFQKDYLFIKNKAEWRGQVFQCQKWFLLDYYKGCYDVVSNNEVLLDRLWVVN